MKATFTLHRIDRDWADILVGAVWAWEVKALNDGVPWRWSGVARTEAGAERQARKALSRQHRIEVYKLNTRTVELYANGEQ